MKIPQTVADSTAAITQVQEKVVGEDIMIVMAVTLLIWVSVFIYLFTIDRKMIRLEKEVNSKT